jgi:hypothetical protein
MRHIEIAFVALVAATHGAVAWAGDPIRSAVVLEFAGPDVLFLADWRGQAIHRLDLTPVEGTPAPFNLHDIRTAIASALSVGTDAFRFEDMKARPGSGVVYISLSVLSPTGEAPALVTLDPAGTVSVIDLATIDHKSGRLTDAPAADEVFWRNLPAQTLTVTDMTFHDGRLYVAGLGDQTFQSSLRIFDADFDAAPQVSTVEIYHAVHNEIETRAPIRTMTIATLDGVETLIAAYTCTPLVTIPLSELQDGTHVVGRTVAELGWGSAPVDMVPYSTGGTDYIMLTNTHRSADLITLADIAAGAAKPGITTPIDWPQHPLSGVAALPTPIGSVAQLDNLDDNLLVALRRDDDSGDMELVTIPKGAYLRLSDFVNEYDFADYRYPPTDAFRPYHVFLRNHEGYPELAARAETTK